MEVEEFLDMEEVEEEEEEVEVEDIMCDQGIITTDWNMEVTSSSYLFSTAKIRVAVAVLAEAIFPAVIGIYYAYLRNQQNVVESVRRQILPSVFAFLANSVSRSLSSVQRGISYPLQLRQLKFSNSNEEDDSVEKCVDCIVLHEPSEKENIAADIIFIHGIHGSLVNTWKQGLWRTDRNNIQKAILDRSKSVDDFDINILKTQLKRSSSCNYPNSPRKMSRMEDELCDLFGHNEPEDIQLEDNEDDDSYSKCWPKDWLSKDCPNTRVIALNYTTDPNLWRPVWIRKRNRSGLVERCKEMIDHLLKIDVGKHPIVWVGHSKGGLYVKQIMLHAWESYEDHLKNLYLQSKAIMFYSVPHRGSTLANFTLPFLSRSIELLEVQKDCRFVLNLHRKFLQMLEDTSLNIDIFSFIETSLTFMSFMYIKIVTLDSADPGIGKKWGVPLDHREICKPSSKNCFLYTELLHLIGRAINGSKKAQLFDSAITF